MQNNCGDKQPPRFGMTPLKNCERKEKRGQAERCSVLVAGCEQQSWMRSRQDKLSSHRSASGGWLTPPNQCTLRDGAARASPADLLLSRQDCQGIFQIGAGYQPAVMEGNNKVQRRSYIVGINDLDQYASTSNEESLDYYGGGNTCQQTCSQQYYNTCTQPQDLDHTNTYTFTKSTISGTKVTLVTVSE